MFNTLKQELILHAKTEEEAFYEPLKEFKATEEEVDHGEEEHQEIEALLEELSGNGLKGKAWQQKFSELQKSVEHHIQEEEGEIFADAKKVLDESTAQQMEIDMKSLKKEQKGILAASSDTL